MTAAFADIFFLLHFKAAHPHDLKNNPNSREEEGRGGCHMVDTERRWVSPKTRKKR
jgi:hypothetical protein